MEGEEEYGRYRYRWVVLAAFMFVAALTQMMWLNYAPILSRTQELMGFTSEMPIVILMLMFPLVYIPVSIPAGFIIDRKGFRYAVMIGALFTAAFSFLRLFVDNYALVLIGMIGISIGQPFVLNSITKMVSTWFPSEESGLASGLATLSLFLGMIVAQALTQPLLEGFGDDLGALRMLVLVYSLAAAAGFLLFAIFGRAKPPKSPKRTETEALGEDVAINMKSLRSLFGLHNFRILCLVILIGNGSFVGLMQLIEDILGPKGITSETAGYIGAVMVLAGVVGCVAIPAISDKLMLRKPFLLLAAFMAAPTLFLVGAFENTALIFVVGGFLGFFLLSALPILLTFAEETTGAHLTGTATSMLFLLGNAGGVVLTLAMEGIKAATGGENYFWAMVFLALLFVALIPFVFRIREKRGARD
ncbi:MAG: MFS transporter [Actinomycetota bacterium]|nr:MFS transporter [Actinomycetota bacterium]MDD5666368.1 MFS transporter [Actinomycetota bacterium]